jgi:putative hemolysin
VIFNYYVQAKKAIIAKRRVKFMPQILWEILIVLFLTLLNGFFSMSEIALISIRRTRVASLVKQGNKRAKIIQQLQQTPERLFATIQIGISVITIFASAFAGSSIAEDLAKVLGRADNLFLAENSYIISFVIVVVLVAYISLVIGELVPKSLGLRYSETFSMFSSYPIWWLSKLSSWLVKILNFSSNIILKLFNDKTTFTESRLSEEEIRTLLSEGRKAGTIQPEQHYMLENIFEFSDLTIGKIMVPRTQITAYDIDQPAKNLISLAIESGYSRIPIYRGNLNNIVGILYTKSLLTKLGDKLEDIDLNSFLLPPYFIPNTMIISEVLKRLQRKKLHMALVTDEHGEIEGLVTLEDVLEEIVGDITDETDEASRKITKQADGTFLVFGEISIVDFNRFFQTDLPEDQDFTTVSGFILNELGRFPKEGDNIKVGDLEFVAEEVTLRTVKTVKVKNKAL